MMANIQHPVRRLILAGGFAAAIAAAPALAVAVLPTPTASTPTISACAPGETEDMATGECSPAMSPDMPGDLTLSTPDDVNSLPEVDGIPCTGHNTGECIGLQESEGGPMVEPQSTLSSSP